MNYQRLTLRGVQPPRLKDPFLTAADELQVLRNRLKILEDLIEEGKLTFSESFEIVDESC